MLVRFGEVWFAGRGRKGSTYESVFMYFQKFDDHVMSVMSVMNKHDRVT